MKRFFSVLTFSLLAFFIISFFLTIQPNFSQMTSKVGTYYLNDNLERNNIPNIVTSIVTLYRGYDTIGEVTVLFLAILGVYMLASSIGLKDVEKVLYTPGFIVKSASVILFPIIVLFGAYIILNGHLSPGGGFQGGAVIGSGMLLLFLSENKKKLNSDVTHLIESFGVSIILLIGLIGLYYLNSFLGNFIPVDGVFGSVLTGGIIPIIYCLIGIKVSIEFFHLVEYLIRS